MKFAKVLQAESVPEWRKQQYLKKLLRQVEKTRTIYDAEQEANRKRHKTQENVGTLSVQSDEKPFRTWSMSSIPGVKPLVDRFMALSNRANFDSVYYRNDVRKNVTLANFMDHVNDDERVFFEKIDKELEMIKDFYKEMEEEALKNFKILKFQYKEMREYRKKQRRLQRNGRRSDRWSNSVSLVKQSINRLSMPVGTINKVSFDTNSPTEDLPPMDFDYKDARKKIKKAVFEFYRGTEFLKNYKVLNRSGFAKILKKFDKLAGWKGGSLYMQKIDESYFVTSKVLDKIIKETENFYVDKFEGGMRKQALSKLRLPNKTNQTYHFSVWRAGVYLGISFCLLFRVADYGLWDVIMDWSLFNLESDNILLRNELGYSRKSVYYFAIVSNFVLRFSWVILAVNKNYSKGLLVFAVAFVEMLRRWQWIFFRVENEHINNCIRGRAIKEVTLPFVFKPEELSTITVSTTGHDKLASGDEKIAAQKRAKNEAARKLRDRKSSSKILESNIISMNNIDESSDDHQSGQPLELDVMNQYNSRRMLNSLENSTNNNSARRQKFSDDESLDEEAGRHRKRNPRISFANVK
ncbi:574_t:CDS:10 [Ambispora leptoticha]|uniref:574_t:CDS:1 n=1 Tax=Ambispora leptoticha TaxID=144679 RepID=A0A9N8V026_9GLOM|nr:574_t:CDS:10 [Ambispora leptoticha]